MTDEEYIERRLAAVERALTDGSENLADPDTDDGLRTDAALTERVESLEADATGLQQRVADLDAAVQALRGYVGSVRHVNRSVERRAEAALATVERVERTAQVERAERTERSERTEASHTGVTDTRDHTEPD